MEHRPQDSRTDYDLDSTDELPVLDRALAAAATDDDLSATGEWPPLTEPQAEPAGDDPLSTTGEWPPLEAPGDRLAGTSDEAIAALTTTLREKSFAIARLERELEAARAAARRQVRASPAEVAVLERRLAEVEQQRLALAAQHDQRGARLAAAEEALAAERTRHAILEAAAEARLVEREAALIEAETRLAAESMRAGALQAEVERLKAELAERASPRAGHDGGAVGQAQAAELRRLREELREARLHADRLLEQLRSREALRRYGEDLRSAGAAPQVPQAAVIPAASGATAPPAADSAPPPRATLPRRYLVRLDEPGAPLQVLAQERIRVGRTAENDLRLDEIWMSRHHATLRLGAETTVVEDAGSTNGVFVNGRRVRREFLRDGDELAFGKARFRFHVHRPGGARD
jgi:hypothetical protein